MASFNREKLLMNATLKSKKFNNPYDSPSRPTSSCRIGTPSQISRNLHKTQVETIKSKCEDAKSNTNSTIKEFNSQLRLTNSRVSFNLDL